MRRAASDGCLRESASASSNSSIATYDGNGGLGCATMAIITFGTAAARRRSSWDRASESSCCWGCWRCYDTTEAANTAGEPVGRGRLQRGLGLGRGRLGTVLHLLLTLRNALLAGWFIFCIHRQSSCCDCNSCLPCKLVSVSSFQVAGRMCLLLDLKVADRFVSQEIFLVTLKLIPTTNVCEVSTVFSSSNSKHQPWKARFIASIRAVITFPHYHTANFASSHTTQRLAQPLHSSNRRT